MGFRGNHLSPWFVVSLLLSLAIIARSSEKCVYTIYIRTGSIWKGGTESTIGVVVGDATGDRLTIPNLVSWGGLMGAGHNYFERGNLDVFSGLATCLKGPVCYMKLTSDGTGEHHGWYCNYVEVTTTGVHKNCYQQHFEVEQWLATDASPYKLFAVRDECKSSDDGVESVDNNISVSAVSSDVGNNTSVSAVSSDVM